MYLSYDIHTAPEGLPLSLLTAAQQLRIDLGGCDDDLVSLCVSGCTDWVQRRYGMLIMNQTVTEYHSGFPLSVSECMSLMLRPLGTVEQVEYISATTGAWTTWPDTEYNVGRGSYGTLILMPKATKQWPVCAWDVPAAVRITATGGYANAEAVPASIRQAILLLLADFYENRENPSLRPDALTAAERLMQPFLMPLFAP